MRILQWGTNIPLASVLGRTGILAAILTLFFCGGLISLERTVFGVGRASTNYQIQFDSLNTAGQRSSSSNYDLEDTIGEQATGRSDSTSYNIKAGYQQMDNIHLAISDVVGPVTLEPGMSLTTDNSVNGATWTVTTDNPGGYELDVRAASTPAMQHTSLSHTFADYTESTPGTPDTWDVDFGAYEFGYSPYGADVSDVVYGTNDDCGSVTLGNPVATERFYDGFTTTNVTIATGGATGPSGTDTTICFAAGQSGVLAPSGTYNALVTLTAAAL